MTQMTSDLLTIFRRDGIAVLPELLSQETIGTLLDLCDPLLTQGERRRPGVRRVFAREPRIADILRQSEIAEFIESATGVGSTIIRAVLFDKTPDTNWLVPWHQDATIAVAERIDVPGFGPWAIKDGEHHCQPPLEIMESIVTIRLHLDACTRDNGPMRVIKRSHTRGLLDDATIRAIASNGEVIEATTPRGGAVITTPLAIHSSPKSIDPTTRRRILHLDLSNLELPGGLRWAEAACPQTT